MPGREDIKKLIELGAYTSVAEQDPVFFESPGSGKNKNGPASGSLVHNQTSVNLLFLFF